MNIELTSARVVVTRWLTTCCFVELETYPKQNRLLSQPAVGKIVYFC